MVFQRKPPAKKRAPALRRFIGLTGSPLGQGEVPVVDSTERILPGRLEPSRTGAMFTVVPDPPKKKLGRPPKHATEAERKAADAARKRGERAEANEEQRTEKIKSELPSVYNTEPEDALKRAGQGGASNKHLERRAQGTSAAMSAPDALIADDVDGTVDNLLGPTSSVSTSEHIKDRKHTAVPINPDENTSEKSESDGTFVWRAFTREAASIKAWIKKGSGQKRPCEKNHQRFADAALKDNPAEKAWCSSCWKLLIDPGKDVKGISRTPPNSCPETPPSPASS